MQRTIPYQGAIIRDDHILHCHHASGYSYWLLTGGEREGMRTVPSQLCHLGVFDNDPHIELLIKPIGCSGKPSRPATNDDEFEYRLPPA